MDQVAELKEELEKLGEPTDGLKAALVKRLTKALKDNKVSTCTTVLDNKVSTCTTVLDNKVSTYGLSQILFEIV